MLCWKSCEIIQSINNVLPKNIIKIIDGLNDIIEGRFYLQCGWMIETTNNTLSFDMAYSTLVLNPHFKVQRNHIWWLNRSNHSKYFYMWVWPFGTIGRLFFNIFKIIQWEFFRCSWMPSPIWWVSRRQIYKKMIQSKLQVFFLNHC